MKKVADIKKKQSKPVAKVEDSDDDDEDIEMPEDDDSDSDEDEQDLQSLLKKK